MRRKDTAVDKMMKKVIENVCFTQTAWYAKKCKEDCEFYDYCESYLKDDYSGKRKKK